MKQWCRAVGVVSIMLAVRVSTSWAGDAGVTPDAIYQRAELYMTANVHSETTETELATQLRALITKDSDQMMKAMLMLGRIREIRRSAYPKITGKQIEEAHGSLGVAVWKAGKRNEGLKEMLADARALSAPAQIMLKILYKFNTDGLKRYDPKILAFFKATAEEGLPQSQLFYGEILINGWGVKQDVKAGIKHLKASDLGEAWLTLSELVTGEDARRTCFQMAADRGEPYGHYNLGICAQTARDYKTAVACFEKTLELDPDVHVARLELARMYLEGWGVETDLVKGTKLMETVAEKAAGRVQAVAQTNMGFAYMIGRGVPKSLDKAKAFFGKAAKAGVPEAIAALKRLDVEAAQ